MEKEFTFSTTINIKHISLFIRSNMHIDNKSFSILYTYIAILKIS